MRGAGSGAGGQQSTMGAQGTAVLSAACISSSTSAPVRSWPRRACVAAASSSAASTGRRSSADS